MNWGYTDYGDYVPVAERIANAKAFAARKAKKRSRKCQPVEIKGNKIAKTFWGKAWCDHMESFSDYSNRLPRGRTYARNGSIVDLQISTGRIKAVVGGSEVYEIDIKIEKLKVARWKTIRQHCSTQIDSMLDLLAGTLSDGVMQRLTNSKEGLFPSPREISLDCDCPDGARLCKHLAAVLYGVGAHLDHSPDLLFLLRGVDQSELISQAVAEDNLSSAFGDPSSDLAGEDLSAMFGIELDVLPAETPVKKKASGRKKATTSKKKKKAPSRKKAAAKKNSPAKEKTQKKATAKKNAASTSKVAKAEAKTVKKKASTAKKKAKASSSPKPASKKKKSVAKKKAQPSAKKKPAKKRSL